MTSAPTEARHSRSDTEALLTAAIAREIRALDVPLAGLRALLRILDEYRG
jgi:hypothetical protein